jgi:hypothetical protein
MMKPANHRRHLSESQRGMVGAKLANLQHGQRSDSAIALSQPTVTQKQAAEMLHLTAGARLHLMALLTHPKLEHIRRNARRYSVQSRTIYRWLADGVDIESPLAVLAYLLTQRTPSKSALEAVGHILQSNQTKP